VSQLGWLAPRRRRQRNGVKNLSSDNRNDNLNLNSNSNSSSRSNNSL